MTYAREMTARLPPTLPLSEELRAVFDWIEANAFKMASGATRQTIRPATAVATPPTKSG